MLELMWMYVAIWAALIFGACIADCISENEVKEDEFCQKRTDKKAHQKE